ncbi:lytic murein transglycosylase B [Erwinia tracheiphila]|uniref:Murein hydrolase effector LrgB n=1 Tax=Erwinia tracheiphila TaxID=65700 RepID=A0A0M2K5Z8_9GAMM|nr:lytic murein transglycosylase B [Erwinia tracheiphila]EOS92725.1 murein hydrolase B [Erwinia tracheiphila PSU-1]KKF34379.1 murein hydrolase effector LrgB [Erwinia tracheiphila]UIA89604.1 lytic murein transglycosylase B [Erwinia tracheiphila]UIA97948.1 lytic murein transglycosylase B [Erwinia tracheiphila]
MRYLVSLLLPLILLPACSSGKLLQHEAHHGNPFRGGNNFLNADSHTVAPLDGDFSDNPAVDAFIDKMVREHNFNRQQLHDVLAQAKRLDWVLRLMERQAPSYQPPSGPNGAWIRYRNKFIVPDNVQNGVQFWNQYQDALNRAWLKYGVPPEIIVGIIGVETRWGRVMGKTRIIDALTTLSFAYPRRADYFSGELETFLLMSRKENDDPLALRGSFAGAMGYGQFMPSSYKQYAVDFNNDGHINLWDPEDAIGSIAHYFSAHGWQKEGTVAVPANGQVSPLENGFKTRYTPEQLSAAGLSPQVPLNDQQQVSLLRFDMGQYYQYWYGLPNFYVITRYNNNNHYAMAVWQLGEAVRDAGRF